MNPTLKSLLEAKAAVIKEFETRGKELVLGEVRRLFDTNPKLVAVGWGQWAPHFNDGDACIFSVHEMHTTFGEAGEGEQEELDIEERDEGEGFSPYDGWPDSGGEEQCKLSCLLSDAIMDEDLLKMAFGEDCRVIITKGEDGKLEVDNDYYEHD